MHQVHARAGPRQPAHRAGLDRQVVLARLSRARPGQHDDGLHAAQACHVVARSVGYLRCRKRRRLVQGSGALRHPSAQGLGRRRESHRPHVAPVHAGAVPVELRHVLPQLDSVRRGHGLVVGKVPRHLRQVLPPAPGIPARAAAGRQPLLQQDAAHAVHHLPDPDAVHRRR
ncbi:hypothetical protein SDC9_175277 [bioreactor metagenome]|uniref:Uncharacterized protein n=1 Tax=bioreactor metagenome TaxID=1076179 RepID=A0A645GW17_9ZZZZ